MGFFWSIKLTWEKIFLGKEGGSLEAEVHTWWFLVSVLMLIWLKKYIFQQVVQVSGWDMNWFFPTKNTIIYSKFFGLICLASQKRLIHNKFIKVFRIEIYIYMTLFTTLQDEHIHFTHTAQLCTKYTVKHGMHSK